MIWWTKNEGVIQWDNSHIDWQGIVTKTCYHTPLPFSRAKCDICLDFDTNNYPNTFPPNNARMMMWRTKNKGVIKWENIHIH